MVRLILCEAIAWSASAEKRGKPFTHHRGPSVLLLACEKTAGPMTDAGCRAGCPAPWDLLGIRRGFLENPLQHCFCSVFRSLFASGVAVGDPRKMKHDIFSVFLVFRPGRPQITLGTSSNPPQNLPKPTPNQPRTSPDLGFCDRNTSPDLRLCDPNTSLDLGLSDLI